MKSTLLGMVKLVKDWQSSKAHAPMHVIEFPIVKLLKRLHSENDWTPMEVTESGSVTCVKEEQPVNAYASIKVTEFEMITADNERQLAKAFFSTDVAESGIRTVIKASGNTCASPLLQHSTASMVKSTRTSALGEMPASINETLLSSSFWLPTNTSTFVALHKPSSSGKCHAWSCCLKLPTLVSGIASRTVTSPFSCVTATFIAMAMPEASGSGGRGPKGLGHLRQAASVSKLFQHMD